MSNFRNIIPLTHTHITKPNLNFLTATNLGPVIGPAIGGPLADKAGWRWIFWFLTILGTIFLLAILLFLPESCRRIVGNGSIPAKGWSRNWISYLPPSLAQKSLNDTENCAQVATEIEKIPLPLAKRLKSVLPNPWKSIHLLFQKDTSLTLSVSAVFYMVYYIVQASLPALLSEIYGFNATDIGLCYFAIGSGVAIGTYINGISLSSSPHQFTSSD